MSDVIDLHPPAKRGSAPGSVASRITPAKARAMVAQREQKRAERIAAQKEREALADSIIRSAPVTGSGDGKADPFILDSLVRCRKQLDSLYLKLEQEKLTPAETDKIASAISKFSEIERNLAMRPSPGSLKPDAPKTTQSRAAWLLGIDTAPSVPTQSSSGQNGRAEQE